MMQGYVNTSYEAVISLVIKRNSKLKSINAVLDKGFTGFLSLPQSIIDELELPWSYSDFATLGDGSETLFDMSRVLLRKELNLLFVSNIGPEADG